MSHSSHQLTPPPPIPVTNMYEVYDDSLQRICFIETTSGGAVLAIALVRRLCLFLYVNKVLEGNRLIPLTRSSSSYLYLNLNDWLPFDDERCENWNSSSFSLAQLFDFSFAFFVFQF